MNRSSLLMLAALSALVGCVKAPNVSVVDSKTALERQAAGEYPALENDLEQAGIAPQPEAYPREDLVSGSDQPGSGALGEVAELYAKAESDADAIDRLLTKKCIGEALNGFLEPRPSDCTTTVNTAEMTRVIGRANLHRRQIWQLISSERKASVEKTRTTWREVHVTQIVCGGLLEGPDGWSPKPC